MSLCYKKQAQNSNFISESLDNWMSAALPTCDYALQFCSEIPSCISVYNRFRTVCGESSYPAKDNQRGNACKNR